MCNILYVCTKIQLFLSHTQRGFVGHLTWPFCSVSLLSALCEAYKVKVNSSAAEGDFMTYKASVVEVLKNTDTGERSQNTDWQLTHLLWHIREWVFHLLSRPKFCSFFKKKFSCSICCGEGTHRGGAVEKGHLQCGHHPEQQSVPGDGSEWDRDHSGQQIQVSVAPPPPPLPPDPLLLLTGCVAWVSQVSPPSGLGGTGGAVAHRLHHPRVSGLRRPVGGLRAGATVGELPRIVKPRNAAEQISDQHFLNWAMNGSVQRGYR